MLEQIATGAFYLSMVKYFPKETTMHSSYDRTHAVRRFFGAAASSYASSPIHASGPDLEAMLSAAGNCAGSRVLDVGCGAGHTALAFAPHASEVIAVDLTQAMLDTAHTLAQQRGLTNLAYEIAAAEALPYEDGRFDLVTSRFCAHHYADPARATEQAARVLAPGGRYLLVDTLAADDPAQDTYLNALELLRDPSHVRNHTRAQWQRWFEQAGLGFEFVATFPLRIEFEPWVERIGTSAQARSMLRTLLQDAPDEIRAALDLRRDGGHDFTQHAALMVGRKPAPV
jgi:ubiquinone/menaquinone biosynthesis C-methylase UbiE